MKKVKTKIRFSPSKLMYCTRCGCTTTHMVYDLEKKIYKCILCKTIHA